MARANQNPLGLIVPTDVTLVLVGKRGAFTHLYDPTAKMHACQSGKNAGRGGKSGAMLNGERPLQLFKARARNLTCYRCIKIAEMNKKKFGTLMPPVR